MFAHDLTPTATSCSLPLQLAELGSDLATQLSPLGVTMTLVLRARTLYVAFDQRPRMLGPPLVELFLAAFNEDDWPGLEHIEFEGRVFGAATPAWTHTTRYPLSYAPRRAPPRRRRARRQPLIRGIVALVVTTALGLGARAAYVRWAPLAATVQATQTTLVHRWQRLHRRARVRLTRPKTLPRRSAAGIEPFQTPAVAPPLP